jgi:hypothetical protein
MKLCQMGYTCVHSPPHPHPCHTPHSLPLPHGARRCRLLHRLHLAKLSCLSTNLICLLPPFLRASRDCVRPIARSPGCGASLRGVWRLPAQCGIYATLTAVAMSAPRALRLSMRNIIGSAFAPACTEKQTELQRRQCRRLAAFFASSVC